MSPLAAARNCLALRGSVLPAPVLTTVEAITTSKQAVREVPMVVRKEVLVMIKQKKTTLKPSLQHLQAVLNRAKPNWQSMESRHQAALRTIVLQSAIIFVSFVISQSCSVTMSQGQ
jgi:hypothetical protein